MGEWRRFMVPGAMVTLILAGCSSGAPEVGNAAAPREVPLTMNEQLRFVPDRIEVRPGETVRFVVRNVSNQAHEAYIGTEAEQRLHATVHAAVPADEQTNTTHVGYAVHVPPFGNGELVAVFAAGTEYVIGCHYPGHYEAGMRATIEVVE